MTKFCFKKCKIISGSLFAVSIALVDYRKVNIIIQVLFRTEYRPNRLQSQSGLAERSWQRITTSRADEASFVDAADIDGDDDFNAISASDGNNTIAWYENEDGRGTFRQESNTISENSSGAISVYAADIDGNADLDVLAAS